jgi:hypothetical protein
MLRVTVPEAEVGVGTGVVPLVALEKTEFVVEAGGGVADFRRTDEGNEIGACRISTPIMAHKGKMHLHA